MIFLLTHAGGRRGGSLNALVVRAPSEDEARALAIKENAKTERFESWDDAKVRCVRLAVDGASKVILTSEDAGW